MAVATVPTPVATFFQLVAPRTYIAADRAKTDADNMAIQLTSNSIALLTPGTNLIAALRPTIIRSTTANPATSNAADTSNLSVGIEAKTSIADAIISTDAAIMATAAANITAVDWRLIFFSSTIEPTIAAREAIIIPKDISSLSYGILESSSNATVIAIKLAAIIPTVTDIDKASSLVRFCPLITVIAAINIPTI